MGILVIAVILGLVEGVTEFIPVSSTGHLIVAGHLLGYTGEKADTFEIFIQMGAILAVVLLEWRRFLGLLAPASARGGFSGRRGLGLLALTTMPVLLVGFFLPGDSFLFTIGVVAGAAKGQLDIVAICTLLVTASILGDQCGYFLGNRVGVRIFDRPDTRFFKRRYITETEAFYHRHGGKTLIYAKFVPIIRTFAPFMAGVGKMPYLRFLSFNVVGGLAWVLLVVIAGFYLGQFAIVRRHFEKIVILVVLISVAPIAIQVLRNKLASRQARQ